MSDERTLELELCHRCVDGDSEAWDQFFRVYRPYLNILALRLCRHSDEAEELVSRLIVSLMEKQKLAQYSGTGSLRGWLRSVMVNLFLDDRRKESRNSLEELTGNPLLADYASLADAIGEIRAIQVQSNGTLGGDLCHLPNCWYFRNGYVLLGM